MARYNRRYIEAEQNIVAINSGSLPFTESLVHAAPRVTGCSWEVAADPEARYRELMREYASVHRCLPLWNDPQRLPTA